MRIRDISKVLQASSGVMFGRFADGVGPGQEASATTVRNFLQVLTETQIATAYQPISANLTSISASSFNGSFGSLEGIPGSFPPSSHWHAWSEITTGLPTTLTGYGITDGMRSLNALSGTSQTFQTGTGGTDFEISSTGTTHTFSLPDASGASRGAVNTSAQTFGGVKTFANGISVQSIDSGGALSIQTNGAERLNLSSSSSAAVWFVNNQFVNPGGVQNRYRRSLGTVASPTAVTSGTVLGQLLFDGWDGATWSGSSGQIAVVASENFTGSAHGGYIRLGAIPTGSTTVSNTFYLHGTGAVVIGQANYTTEPPAPVKLNLRGNNNAATENNLLRFTDADPTTQANQLVGGFDFESLDSSPVSAGVRAYYKVYSAGTGPAVYTSIATCDTDGAVAERLRITESGPIRVTHSVFRESEVSYTPSGTTQTIPLNAGNYQSLSLAATSGNPTITLTVPAGPASGSLIVLQHGSTPRNITWALSTGSIKWLGSQPAWSSDAVSSYRVVSWRWNGSIMFLMASESGT